MSKNREKKMKANTLSEHYRSNIMNNETLELLPKEEFSNLIDVAKYADFGLWTAIETAFCMGYVAGKDDAE